MANILIVEDDANLREAYIDILEIDGHTVTGVESAVEAIESLSKNVPDVVFLDMNLLGGSGLAVLSFIQHFSRLSSTKVVVVSGYPQLRSLATSSWGADLFLAKPFTVTELQSALVDLNVETALVQADRGHVNFHSL